MKAVRDHAPLAIPYFLLGFLVMMVFEPAVRSGDLAAAPSLTNASGEAAQGPFCALR